MTVSRRFFLKVVDAHSVQGRKCTECGTNFTAKDSRKVFLTTTNHFFCGYCYHSDMNVEATATYYENFLKQGG